MVGGADTKVFAYGFSILSLSSFLQSKYARGMFFAGFSLSFHLLIGLYNFFCLIPILVFFQRKNNIYWVSILKSLPVFFIAGGIGCFGVINHFFLQIKMFLT